MLVLLLYLHEELILPVLDYEFDGPDTVRPDYDKINPEFSQTNCLMDAGVF